MSEDHDWVARLLAASGPAPMPEDVSERLGRALRQEAERVGAEAAVPSTTPAVTGPGTAATDGDGPVPSVVDPDSPDDRSITGMRAGASAGTSRAGGTTNAGSSTTPSTDEQAPTAPSATGVPPAAPLRTGPPSGTSSPAVPPPATTGSVPRLRSVPPAGGTTDPAGTGPAPTVVEGSRARGSRRELREEDQGERRRRALTRWAPVAAGVLVLGGAAAVVGTQLGGEDAATSADVAAEEAAVDAATEAQPSVLVASGAQYTTTDRAVFDAQVRDLVALAAADDATAAGGADDSTLAQEATPESAAGAAPTAAASAPASAPPAAAPGGAPGASDEAAPQLPAGARSAAEGSALADPQRLAECVGEVTEGTSTTAAAVDLAVVDGVQSTVIVVPDAAGLTYQVYVVGADCSAVDTSFKFFTVTP